MCGIIGYYGPKEPVHVIMGGLKSLESRGYDSAGVAILDRGSIKRVRAEGKLSQLQSKLEGERFDGHLGIGHTRWATHGPPIERNAHPHCVKGVSIVHNGIIENYAELRGELQGVGAWIDSDTDSELVAHLISQKKEEGMGLLEGVMAIVPRLCGAYSILAISEDQPDELVAFKSGPPLIVGLGGDSIIVASDILAIVPYTRTVFYLKDHEVILIKGGEVGLFNQAGEKLQVETTELEWSEDRVEKQGYSHFMLKEIYEQPRAVAAVLSPHIDIPSKSIRLSGLGFQCQNIKEREDWDFEKDLLFTDEVLRSSERIFIVACGTSFYAGMMGEYIIESFVGIPVEIDIASEFRYRRPVIPPRSLVILISQSGETADTLAALKLVKESGVRVLSICNVRNSTLDRESHGHLYMNAGVEVGVASTKALTCTVVALNLLALYMAKVRGKLTSQRERGYVQALLEIPHQMENVLAYDGFFSEAANTLKKYRGFLYMGRGIHYPVAMEGALKLKELAYMHAEGYAAGEMKHGPLALIDKNMGIVMLAPSDVLYEKTISNLEEAKARGGQIISIGTGDNEKLKSLSVNYLSLPKVKWSMTPLLELIPLQLLAFHVAEALGHDVDRPRNLAKSVTVE